MAIKLKNYKKYYRYYVKKNQQRREAGKNKRKMYNKGKGGCCKGKEKVDAEDHFRKKI